MEINGAQGETTKFEIPILPDMYGTTPLDICLAINKQRDADRLVFSKNEDEMNAITASENEAMAEVIFNNIKDYGFMHSSQLINEGVIQAIKLNLPSLGDYLDSRLIAVKHCFSSNT